ncbi:MAG: class I SAM-dependent methyltransferase [Firmicutes bacterium]|nr:class I SAM-dependent methyltransferase [Bacillota bacterium]MDH7495778.1 class I SAM-dependent methyltransferase [Bacillota bacterium]
MLDNRPDIGNANRAYYDAVSCCYDAKHGISSVDMGWFIEDVKRLLGEMPAGVKVLDCGAGTGRCAIKFAKAGNEVLAIDVSGRILDRCRMNASLEGVRVSTLEADCCRIPLPSGTFDIVAFCAALHHIQDVKQALAEAGRLLKPGGRLLLMAEPKASVIRPAWMRRIKDRLSDAYDRSVCGQVELEANPDVHIFMVRELRSLLKALGFGSIRVWEFFCLTSIYRDLVYYRIRDNRVRSKLYWWLYWIDRRALGFLPSACKALFHLAAVKEGASECGGV